MIHPDVWLERLDKVATKTRDQQTRVDQILAVIGDDGHVDWKEATEIAEAAYAALDDWRFIWEIASKMAAAGLLGELEPLEVAR